MQLEKTKKIMNNNFYKAFQFANEKHKNQKITGSDFPYISHISQVCFEIFQIPHLTEYDNDFLFTVACLHDTLEDTDTTEDEIYFEFGEQVLFGVKALSKNYDLPKQIQLEDSLNRILIQPIEVQVIKLADRLTNLNPPPKNWSLEKITAYYDSSIMLYEKLKYSDQYLVSKLKNKLNEYRNYTTK